MFIQNRSSHKILFIDNHDSGYLGMAVQLYVQAHLGHYHILTKKDLCVDFCRLNKVTKADSYPILRVYELIDRIGRAQYIIALDLTKGYWQVPVAKESQ